MKKYICTVEVEAEPMTKAEAEEQAEQLFDEFDNPNHEGYLCYSATGTRFIDKEAFETMFTCVETFIDRMEVEWKELNERTDKLFEFIHSPKYQKLESDACALAEAQYREMVEYRQILWERILLSKSRANY